MSTMKFWCASVALGLGLLATAAARAADDKPGPTGSNAGGAPAGNAAKYYELRIYTAAAGKMDALHARFRDHTIRLFKKHGIENVGYWTGTGKEEGKLFFMIAYPDAGSRDRLWNAFGQDPDWVKAKAESEKDGKLVDSVQQIFLNPTDYSPVK